MKALILIFTTPFILLSVTANANVLSCKGILAATHPISKTVDPGVSPCIGQNCTLANVMRSIAIYNGEKRELSGQAMNNVRKASARAQELTALGIDADLAQHMAFAELGLNGNQIKDNCSIR